MSSNALHLNVMGRIYGAGWRVNCNAAHVHYRQSITPAWPSFPGTADWLILPFKALHHHLTATRDQHTRPLLQPEFLSLYWVDCFDQASGKLCNMYCNLNQSDCWNVGYNLLRAIKRSFSAAHSQLSSSNSAMIMKYIKPSASGVLFNLPFSVLLTGTIKRPNWSTKWKSGEKLHEKQSVYAQAYSLTS